MIEGEESPMSESRQVRKTEAGSEKFKGEGALGDEDENMENILTISPLGGGSPEAGKLVKSESKKHLTDLRTSDFRTKNALRMGADTGPAPGSGRAVAKACAV